MVKEDVLMVVTKIPVPKIIISEISINLREFLHDNYTTKLKKHFLSRVIITFMQYLFLTFLKVFQFLKFC